MSNREANSAQSTSAIIDQIELLVEGELTLEAKSQLLLRLDAQPEQWRNLALAYVEHQTLRDSIQRACHPKSTGTEPNHRAPMADSRLRLRWSSFLAAACSLTLAFLLGMGTGKTPWNFDWSGKYVPSGSGAATSGASPHTSDPKNTNLRQDPRISPMGPRVAATETVPGDGISNAVVGYVEWVGSFGRQLSPVFKGDQIDQEWLELHPPQINERLEKKFARAGWQVTPARKFISLTMAEGKRFLIPMDDVSYRYVGRKLF